MGIMKLKSVFILVVIILVSSCKKTHVESNQNIQSDSSFLHHWLVINEGLWHYNNASVSVINENKTSVLKDQFYSINKRRLGDIANDAFVYGSKVYVIVSESNTIEVLDKKTLISQKQLSLVDSNGIAFQPRNGVGLQGKIWITCFKGSVVAIDTVSYSIIYDIKVGKNPEGISVLQGKIVVTNSGGLDYPTYDSTISFVDPVLAKETKKVKVGINPGGIYVENDLVYVNCRGNYDEIKSKIVVLDANGNFKHNLSINPSVLSFQNNKLLGISSDLDGTNASIVIFDLSTNSILTQQKLADITTPSFVQWIDDTHFWIGDANSYQSSGYVSKYETNGKLVHKYAVGMIPNECIFLK